MHRASRQALSVGHRMRHDQRHEDQNVLGPLMRPHGGQCRTQARRPIVEPRIDEHAAADLGAHRARRIHHHGTVRHAPHRQVAGIVADVGEAAARRNARQARLPSPRLSDCARRPRQSPRRTDRGNRPPPGRRAGPPRSPAPACGRRPSVRADRPATADYTAAAKHRAAPAPPRCASGRLGWSPAAAATGRPAAGWSGPRRFPRPEDQSGSAFRRDRRTAAADPPRAARQSAWCRRGHSRDAPDRLGLIEQVHHMLRPLHDTATRRSLNSCPCHFLSAIAWCVLSVLYRTVWTSSDQPVFASSFGCRTVYP